jgi:Protein of unknown function DUF104
MKITADDLSRSYRAMSDEELLAMDQGELTDMARKTLEQEMERRGLTHLDPSAPPPPVEVDGEAWASAGTFRTHDEAELVRGALESAGIPAEVDSDSGDLLWMGTTVYTIHRVLAPESMLDDARAIIESRAVQEEHEARSAADPLPAVVLARYEDGVFKPVEDVDLDEGTEVEVHLPKAH